MAPYIFNGNQWEANDAGSLCDSCLMDGGGYLLIRTAVQLRCVALYCAVCTWTDVAAKTAHSGLQTGSHMRLFNPATYILPVALSS